MTAPAAPRERQRGSSQPAVRAGGRAVDVVGCRLFTRTWGRPGHDRPLLVLVHGLVVSRLLAPTADLPGYGRSEPSGDR